MNRQVSRRLHEEHTATLALWNRFEQAIAARTWPPAAGDLEIENLLRGCAAALAEELSHHFEFEESELFPRLADGGEGDIADLLAEEHVAIRAAAQAFSKALQAGNWQSLRTAGLELSERLAAHVQKEEMSLLPAIENLLDEETDARLALAYAS
ncbi:MAG: hemerythrin domain-containing protein [Burkholderiales bacterium]